MTSRVLFVTAALAAAAVLTPAFTALAKEDPAERKAARDEVRKKYKESDRPPFGDLSYYLDKAKLKDKRWEIKDSAEPKGVDDGHPMFYATFPSGNASDAKASIELYVWRSPHYKDNGGGARSVFSHEFKAWGKSIQVSDVKDMAMGYYQDFILSATELRKEDCKASAKKDTGVAEYWGCAVGTYKEDSGDQPQRMRRDWYVWSQSGKNGAFTWLARFETSAKFIDNEDWLAKIPDFMKNVKELSDPKLK